MRLKKLFAHKQKTIEQKQIIHYSKLYYVEYKKV